MVEFALLLPIFVTMIIVLVNIEIALSSGIVSQKYARQHQHFLMFNHRHYLEHGFLERSNGSYMKKTWTGVSNDVTFTSPNPVPVAPTVKVGKYTPGSDKEKGNVDERQHIRIRSLAFICIPPIGPQIDTFYSTGGLAEDTFLAGKYHFCEE